MAWPQARWQPPPSAGCSTAAVTATTTTTITTACRAITARHTRWKSAGLTAWITTAASTRAAHNCARCTSTSGHCIIRNAACRYATSHIRYNIGSPGHCIIRITACRYATTHIHHNIGHLSHLSAIRRRIATTRPGERASIRKLRKTSRIDGQTIACNGRSSHPVSIIRAGSNGGRSSSGNTQGIVKKGSLSAAFSLRLPINSLFAWRIFKAHLSSYSNRQPIQLHQISTLPPNSTTALLGRPM